MPLEHRSITMPSPEAIDRMIAALAEHRIEWLLTVPTTGIARLYESFERRSACLYATREEEAIALASGLALGGRRPVVVMQQTGVGNAINAVLSLADAYRIPFPVIVCDRTPHDPNLVQRVSSRGTLSVLAVLGCAELDWELPGAVDDFRRHVSDGARWLVCPMRGSE